MIGSYSSTYQIAVLKCTILKILKSEIFGFSNGGSDAEIGVEDLLNDRITTPNFGPSLEKDMMKELNKVILTP